MEVKLNMAFKKKNDYVIKSHILVEYIGYENHVDIPDDIIGIGENAFESCFSVKSIFIPKSVVKIADNAFDFCSELTKITVDETNPAYSSEDGVLFNKNKTKIIKYPDRKRGGIYIVPNSVSEIGGSAFFDCWTLKTINIHAGVSKIHTNALSCYSKLTEIYVDKENPVYISENGILFNKAKTVLIQYPAGKRSAVYAIPDGVVRIEEFAFCSCRKLKGILIPESVTEIGKWAFENSGLTDIVIPKSLILIEDGAFNGSKKLKKIRVDESNPAFSSEDGVLFNKEKSELIKYPEGCKNKTYNIPDGVIHLKKEAFFGCENLKTLSIPESVTEIENDSFRWCFELSTILGRENHPAWKFCGTGWYDKYMDS